LNTANWVHHVPYLLPQGRMTWENPFEAKESDEPKDEEDEEEKEEENDAINVEPETGPAMLTAVNSDEGNIDLIDIIY